MPKIVAMVEVETMVAIKAPSSAPNVVAISEKHSDADVGEAFLDVSGGCARRGRDDGDQGGAHGVADVHLEEDRKHGDEDHSSAKPGKRTQKSGQHGSDGDEDCEFQDGHAFSRKQFAISEKLRCCRKEDCRCAG